MMKSHPKYSRLLTNEALIFVSQSLKWSPSINDLSSMAIPWPVSIMITSQLQYYATSYDYTFHMAPLSTNGF